MCELLKSAQPDLSIILQTGDSNINVSQFKNVDTILHKPFDYNTFETAMNDQTFNLPKFSHTRIDQRIPLGKDQASIVLTKGSELALNGLVFNKSMGGCGVILSSASGLNIGDKVNVAQSELNSDTGQQQKSESYEATVVWMELVDIETFKIGLKYN